MSAGGFGGPELGRYHSHRLTLVTTGQALKVRKDCRVVVFSCQRGFDELPHERWHVDVLLGTPGGLMESSVFPKLEGALKVLNLLSAKPVERLCQHFSKFQGLVFRGPSKPRQPLGEPHKCIIQTRAQYCQMQPVAGRNRSRSVCFRGHENRGVYQECLRVDSEALRPFGGKLKMSRITRERVLHGP